MHLVRVFLMLCVMGIASALWAAQTGYSDDFTAGATAGKWPACPGYKASQADGVATLQVDKQVLWAGQTMMLGGTYDFSAHPYLTVQIKTSEPMVLDMYLLGPGGNLNLAQRIRAVPDFQTYGFDFSAATKVYGQVTAVLFTVNGAATSWSGLVQLKALRIGDQAAVLPNLEAVEDQEWYRDTGKHSARIMGINHVAQLSLSGAEKLLRNVTFTDVVPGRCTMNFEIIPGATGTAHATLTAQGAPGYAPVTRTFNVLLQDTLPPTIDAHPPVTAQVGKPCTVRFSGVTGGNFTIYQPLTITVSSSNPAVVDGAEVKTINLNGGNYLSIRGIPKAAGDADLTITLDKKTGANSTVSTVLKLHTVTQWNNPPTLDPITAKQAFVGGGEQQLKVFGISDGDDGKQRLTITAVSSDANILPDPTVVYGGDDFAILHYTPTATPGTAQITVTVTDHGGTPDNNGDQSVSQTFTLTTRVKPITAYHLNMDNFGALKTAFRAEDGVTITPDVDAGTPVLKIACKDKQTYGGLWLTVPAMDLTKAPFLSVDVKCDQNIAFNMYFYDGASHRNDGATRATRIGGGDWQTVTFDFSGKNQMTTSATQPIDSTWITTVLFNFHPNFNWPFSNWTGYIYFRNLRIGTAADIPHRNPVVAMNPLAAQVYKLGSGMQQVVVSGLAVANGKPITLAISEDGDARVTPTVSPVQTGETVITLPDGPALNGTAVITLTAGQAGHDTLTLTASAPGADPATGTFTVDVVDPAAARAVTIDTGKMYQTMRGFGTSYGGDVDLYAKLLGASAIRIGTDCLFNPVKDTSDVNVLNRARFDFKEFKWDYYRQLRANGVETFILTSWTPPAWMKNNFSNNYQPGASSDENRLDYDCYEDFAKTMVAVVRAFQEEGGFNLDAISLQNEPTFCEPYGSAILYPDRMLQLIKVVGRRFEKEGMHTRIFMPEQVFTQGSMTDYIVALNHDPEAQKYCDVVATHSYDDRGVLARNPDFSSWSNMFKLSQQGAGPKELWMTETDPHFEGWVTAMNDSLGLYGALEHGNVSLWTQWGIEGTLLTHNVPNDSFWAERQYIKYIRPGARRVASIAPGNNPYITSFLNDAQHGGELVSVITNRALIPAVLQFTVPGHEEANWRIITTDPVRHCADMGILKHGDPLLLPPNSVTTLQEIIDRKGGNAAAAN